LLAAACELHHLAALGANAFIGQILRLDYVTNLALPSAYVDGILVLSADSCIYGFEHGYLLWGFVVSLCWGLALHHIYLLHTRSSGAKKTRLERGTVSCSLSDVDSALKRGNDQCRRPFATKSWISTRLSSKTSSQSPSATRDQTTGASAMK
jgi:hypothetical protein